MRLLQLDTCDVYHTQYSTFSIPKYITVTERKQTCCKHTNKLRLTALEQRKEEKVVVGLKFSLAEKARTR